MAYVGHCNCKSLRITLREQPPSSVVCHCDNCRRAGGGAFSVNYLVGEDEITVEDLNKTLGIYDDPDTAGGYVIQRYFCTKCGSPAYTKTPKAAGKLYLKASLFDVIAPCGKEVFDHKRVPLFPAEWSGNKTKSD